MNSPNSISKLHRIAIIDDSQSQREAYAEMVEDANLIPIIYDKRIEEINSFLQIIKQDADGAIFDHKLSPRNFAKFDGAEAVAKLYDLKFPAILITTLSQPEITDIRPYRRKIPVLLGIEADRDLIILGFKICLDEFSDKFIPTRKSFNTLFRIIEIESPSVYVNIPGWNPNIKVKVPISLIKEDIPSINLEEGLRLFADINLGAESDEELFFENFTVAEKPKGEYGRLLYS